MGIITVWNQAALNNIVCPPLEEFGWKKLDASSLAIDWESETNVSVVRDQVAFIQKGCGCRTGCSSSRCKCKKTNCHCGPGCKCTGCTNVPVQAFQTSRIQQDCDSESEASSSGSDAETLEDEINTVMYQVFGNFSEDESGENITEYDMDD